MSSLEQEIALASRPGEEPPERLLELYGELSRQFESEEGYLIESRIDSVARGLGFSPGEMDRRVESFSGGEKARADLAALLLSDPELLLLDEPTNFLDFEGLAWLEKYLLDSPATLLVVSHDRFFLDRVVQQIFDLRAGMLQSYSGNYSDYRVRHEAQKKSAQHAYREQQELIARTEKQIRQSKADRRSKRQARSRQKALERLTLQRAPAAERRFKLHLDYSGRSGQQVIIFEKVSKAFDGKRLFDELSFQIRWGDRVALVGPNGAGKSTLLKMIAGLEQPSGGQIHLGPSVNVAYFAQEQEQLNPAGTVLEEITAASELDLEEARTHLGRYLFSGDDVFKKVSSLSGGEKSRLALARLALRPGNCLLVDEPTSHLDLQALEELEAVLQRYPGTLVAVSHDRYFLKGMVNRVFELQNGALTLYEGSFQDYLESREEKSEAKPAGAGDGVDRGRQRALEERRQARQRQNRRRRLLEEQARLEKKIHSAESELECYEKLLSDPGKYGDYNRLRELNRELSAVKEKLSRLLRSWEEVSLQLEQAEDAGPR